MEAILLPALCTLIVSAIIIDLFFDLEFLFRWIVQTVMIFSGVYMVYFVVKFLLALFKITITIGD